MTFINSYLQLTSHRWSQIGGHMGHSVITKVRLPAMATEDALVGLCPFLLSYLVAVKHLLVLICANGELHQLLGWLLDLLSCSAKPSNRVLDSLVWHSQTKCIDLICMEQLVATTDEVAGVLELRSVLERSNGHIKE